ncbi:CsiV family protein [Gilvimarinus chinensis]|uniref:CsiV family protein n=1 Tax=Gilvimarinus chinensis TaxID=396005 RepID=UPI00035C5CE3|nr:CsiV family protein [Gilvimarinus chinensis]
MIEVKTLARTLATGLAMVALSAPPWVYAQANHEGWYQVEVIVYSRPLDTSAETWPTDITLDYPLNWQELRNPETEIAQREERARAKQQERQNLQNNYFGDDRPTPTPESAEGSQEITVEPIDLARDAFFELPADERSLNAVAKRVAAQPGFDILFHEAWRQYVTAEASAPWILINGGKAFGEHFELEGSINVNVSRYLHVFTDLWFTEFQINAGQSRNQWPNLPVNPVKRLQQWEEQSNNSLDYSNLMADAAQTRPEDALMEFLEAPYLPAHIVKLEQQRRMRSNELHYVDHPRLGLLVKITPYKRPAKTEPLAGNALAVGASESTTLQPVASATENLQP